MSAKRCCVKCRHIEPRRATKANGVLAAALVSVAMLCIVFHTAQKLSAAEQPVMIDNRIAIMIQSSGGDKNSKIIIDRSILDPNDPLLKLNLEIPVTDSFSVNLILPDLTVARGYHVRPDSTAELETNEAILATGNLVSVNLHQGTRIPRSVQKRISQSLGSKHQTASHSLGSSYFMRRPI
jgi:hypothetical protein